MNLITEGITVFWDDATLIGHTPENCNLSEKCYEKLRYTVTINLNLRVSIQKVFTIIKIKFLLPSPILPVPDILNLELEEENSHNYPGCSGNPLSCRKQLSKSYAFYPFSS
jgi:hypothetical protein